MRQNPNEWTNLAGNVEYTVIKEKMQKAAPLEFAAEATARNDLKLAVTGDSFHWSEK